MRPLLFIVVLGCTPAEKPDTLGPTPDEPATQSATPVSTEPVTQQDWEEPFLARGNCTRLGDNGSYEVYDAEGWTRFFGEQDGPVTITYSDAGSGRVATASNGQSVTFDARRNITQIAFDGSPDRVCSFTYDDATSRAGSASCSDGSTLSYDACGNPTRITIDDLTIDVDATYRQGCLLADVRYDYGPPVGDLTYLYDEEGRLTYDGVLYTWHCNDGSTEASCEDGADDDGDGLSDCDDPDCDGTEACSGPTTIDATLTLDYVAGPDASDFGWSSCATEGTYVLQHDPSRTCPGCDEVVCGDRTSLTGTTDALCGQQTEICIGIDYGTGTSWQVSIEDEDGVWGSPMATSLQQGVHRLEDTLELDTGGDLGTFDYVWTFDVR